MSSYSINGKKNGQNYFYNRKLLLLYTNLMKIEASAITCRRLWVFCKKDPENFFL